MPLQSRHRRALRVDEQMDLLHEAYNILRRCQLTFASVPNVRRKKIEDLARRLRVMKDELASVDFNAIPQDEIVEVLDVFNALLEHADGLLCARDGVLLRDTAASVAAPVIRSGSVGRPQVAVDAVEIVILRNLGANWREISELTNISRQTLWKHLKDTPADDRPPLRTHTPISDEDLDNLVRQIKGEHEDIGSRIVHGHLEARSIRVSLHRVKESVKRVDPSGTADRYGKAIKRRIYAVRGSKFLWHMDANEKLRPWGFIIHGGVDGHSRLCLWTEVRADKRAATVGRIFSRVVQLYGWPVRVRGDFGTENNDVEDMMTKEWGLEHNAFLRGKSLQNIRMERQWRDIRKDTIEQYRRLFINMGNDGILDMNLRSHRICLLLTYLPRIQATLDSSRSAWNHHKIRTAGNATPIRLYELSRRELIRSDYWAGDGYLDGDDPAIYMAEREQYEGDLAWAFELLSDFDFKRDDGMRGTEVFSEAVLRLTERAADVDDGTDVRLY